MVRVRGMMAVVALVVVGMGQAFGAPPAWMQEGYEALDLAQRKAVQEELAGAGLYTGSVDGASATEVAQALAETPDFLATHTVDKVEVPIDTPADAHRFVAELAAGDWADFLDGTLAENRFH